MGTSRERISASGFTTIAGSVVLLELLLTSTGALAGVSFQDINPNSAPRLDQGAGGRVNSLATVPHSTSIFYAATELGGLYKTIDGGITWFRLNGHLPVRMMDVKVDPVTTQLVYATSLDDGRVNSLAGLNRMTGINISRDGGTTWTRATALIPAGYNCDAAMQSQPQAYGIGIRPDASQHVYIGTNCGLAISTDAGVNWTLLNPNPAIPPTDVWSVIVQAGGPTNQGIVDVCDNNGHFRSTDGGATWRGGTGLPGTLGNQCSLAVSPDEPDVLFVVMVGSLFESDDGGATWLPFDSFLTFSRPEFFRTNQRSNIGGLNRFDLWFGGVGLWRASCTTPPPPLSGVLRRCPQPSSWTDSLEGHSHVDMGDIVFDPTVDPAVGDACPMLLGNDGGVYRNIDLGQNCQTPQWQQPNVSPHALVLWNMAGVPQPGTEAEDLYFATQDDGLWGTRNAGATVPTWNMGDIGDTFAVAADSARVFWRGNPGPILRYAGLDFGGPRDVANVPPGCCPQFFVGSFIAAFGPDQYVLVAPGQGAFNGRLLGRRLRRRY